MEKRLYSEENYKLSKWSGGNTRELAIYPQDSNYLDRDFIWRLSTADSNLEESSFTKLPDFDRILMVLDGQVVLAHGEERTVSLKAMEQDSFDGAVKTKCFGQLKKDYNLIMKKGSRGRMLVIDAEDEGKKIELSDRADPDIDGLGGERLSAGIFCNKGFIVLSINGQTEMIKEGQLMVVNCEPGEQLELTVMGQGQAIFTETIFEREQVSVSEIPSAKATGEDFIMAMKLFLGNNKWNKLMRRHRKSGSYMLPALEKKMKLLDKFMITAMVWALGVFGCLMTLKLGLEPMAVFALVIAYTVVNLFIISPLIYMWVLPKPIRAYVKKADELNKYERKLFEEQLVRDERQDSLMHKYRDRSNEEYSSMGDFIRRLNK